MLKDLHISNYAIIDEILIEFSPRLNVITGETGAGKSILMGALSLILGDRADMAVLMNTERKCFIEGHFTGVGKQEVNAFLKDNDLDIGNELLIRREISVHGKSRAFINDTPVNLSQLKELGSLLVDLHQQFDSLELGLSGFQRQVVDALAGNQDGLEAYQALYFRLLAARKELSSCLVRKSQFEKELDYHKFLFDELEQTGLQETEIEGLENELKRLNSSEEVKNVLSKTYFELKESEEPIVQQLKTFSHRLQPFSAYYDGLPDILHRLQSTQIELQDIASEMDAISQRVQYDPKRIEQVNERLSTVYKLLKKHNVKTTHELLVIQERLAAQLQDVMNLDETIEARKQETAELELQAMEQATVLSKRRQKQLGPLEDKVNQLLAQVGMPSARLKATWQATDLNPYGVDEVELLFDANKSNRFEPIRKVASGGELSRLMLCIKSLVAESMGLAALIFDEIDTGISGEAAKKVGIILKKLSQRRQVICITHQPQIAGKADAHYYVYKEEKNNALKTKLRLLGADERVTHIAKMLSGEKPTAAALENARELLQ